MAVVPGVVGLGVTDAKDKIEAQSLKVKWCENGQEVQDPTAGATATAQSPAADTQVPDESEVTVMLDGSGGC